MSESTTEFGSDGKNSVRTTIVGSLAKLSTEAFPTGVEDYTLIEFYPDPLDNKYYRYYSGQWREI
jgi:hypothetical protein